MVKVTLVDHMGSPQLVFDYLRYLTWPRDLEERLGRVPRVEEMMELIVDRQYTPVLEHIAYTFLLEDMSMAISREFLEHRMASHMGRSSRGFQKGWKPTYVVPGAIQKDPKAKKLYSRIIEESVEGFGELRKMGVKQDDARFALPFGTHCAYLWTINATSLMNFLGLRLCPRAYREVQDMAQQVYDLVRKLHPDLWKFAGCRGVQHRLCPENEARDLSAKNCPFLDPQSDRYIPTKDAVGEPIPPRRRWVPVKWD
ncbi:MAG: FAD-dependent thymidylate synthase [Euryarchaeota archaeon]|nr:FAD-dependent thymidylate synthase [Euryarchaeota archaeon]